MPGSRSMEDAKRDYYEVLGIAPDADAKAIKDAFRTLALKYHPDRNKEPGAEERFKAIAAAYAVLSDPKKRSAYDAGGGVGVAGLSEEELFRDVDFESVFGDSAFDFGTLGMGSVFERFFGRRRAGPHRGLNVEVELEVSLECILTGGEKTVRFARTSRCVACKGTGAQDGIRKHRCAACAGTGQRARESRRRRRAAEVLVRNVSVCAECAGRGEIIDEACAACRGKGSLEQVETLTVRVPVGAEEGLALRVPAHGMPSEIDGGASGDLFVIIRTAPDPRFQRHNIDLFRRETLTVPEAVLGTKRTFPSLDGVLELTIPPATQPGHLLKIVGRGLPELGGARRGDLFVRIEVRIPDHLGRRQRELYRALRALDGEESGA